MRDSHISFLRAKVKFTILISFDALIARTSAIQLCITLSHVKKVMMVRKAVRYMYMEYQIVIRLVLD